MTEKAKKQIIELGYDQNLGARPLKRAIQKHILDSMAIKILSGEIKMGDVVEVSVDSNHNFTMTSMNSENSKLNGGQVKSSA